jgi:hypothetical protein
MLSFSASISFLFPYYLYPPFPLLLSPLSFISYSSYLLIQYPTLPFLVCSEEDLFLYFYFDLTLGFSFIIPKRKSATKAL